MHYTTPHGLWIFNAYRRDVTEWPQGLEVRHCDAANTQIGQLHLVINGMIGPAFCPDKAYAEKLASENIVGIYKPLHNIARLTRPSLN